jgi:hypothetical protein
MNKNQKIKMVKKIIDDQKLIHQYIKEGKDLSELKEKNITFVQPLENNNIKKE